MPQLSGRAKYIILGGIITFALAAFGSAGVYTSKSSFCNSCHQMAPYFQSWKKSSHKQFSCTACHQAPGVSGFVKFRADRLRYLTTQSIYWRRHRPARALEPNSQACLSCHRERLGKTLTAKGIRVSHKEIPAQIFSCSECHPFVGHRYSTIKLKPRLMDKCLVCHNQPANPSMNRCVTCHVRDIGYRVNQLDDYPTVEIQGLDRCDQCHTTVTCNNCHQGRRIGNE